MRPANKSDDEPTARKGSTGNDQHEKSVGDALRAVYRDAVNEAVPDELLDLLKKLD